MTTYASVNGTFRIDEVTFPAPSSSEWEDQELAQGLNGIPINASYRIHRWNFDQLEGEIANSLYDKYQEQQDEGQLGELETDPYDASLATESYGTETYTDFVIISPGVRRRGLPHYENVTVVMEVYVS